MVRINFNPHRTIQQNLLKLLPEAQMERRFPPIGRIADLSWKNFIFEIQLSQITIREVQERIKDYESLGYTVIWLLHDRRYNRRLLSHAEAFLRQNGAYFVHINAKEEVTVYDQYECLEGRKRLIKSARLPVDLSRPQGKGFQGDLKERRATLAPWIEEVEERHLKKRSLFSRIKKNYLKGLNRRVIALSQSQEEV